jgi:hypothetical protein
MSAHLKLKIPTAKPVMDVAILYEDWGTGLRAKQTCEQVATTVPPEVNLSIDLWRFDLLEEETLRTQALNAALDSDLLFVSAHGHRALPTALSSWLRQWLVQKPNEPTGLVISLDATAKGSPTANQILADWAQLAQAAQVDVFLHFGHAPRRERPSLLEHPAPAPARGHLAGGRRPEPA